MNLERDRLLEKSREYERREPLFLVERDRLETLPDAFDAGTLVWKDVEWMVRWYFRRELGSFPRQQRESAERRFKDNSWDAITEVIDAAKAAPTTRETIERLVELKGVTVPVASAIAQFMNPDEYVVVDERVWKLLYDVGSLESEPPDSPSADEYVTYLEQCRATCAEFDVDLQTLYRASRRLLKPDDDR